MPPMDGRLLGGRFRLLESHAMGGMASVWRALDEETGEVVAVKRLHPHLVADADARERLLREASAMASIRHPNVVGIRGAVDGDEPALVMDLVDGRSVAEMATDGHIFAEPEALAIAAGLADGLAAAHGLGIVHRDVKPANVLIGEDGVARLSDFGIAVAPDDATGLTADDGVIGTLRYLAPERLAGEPATPATDVWGVGSVLYELVAGKPAFTAATLAERIETASRPAARPNGVAGSTWSVISNCLNSDPRDRFADGAALAAALHGLPGVPEPALLAVDPSDATEVIPLPVQVAPAETAAADVQPVAAAAPDAHLPRTLSRATWLGGAVAVFVIGLVAASIVGNDPIGAPRESSAVASPEATKTVETPAPTAAVETPVDAVQAQKPGKDKGNGKGKWRGN